MPPMTHLACHGNYSAGKCDWEKKKKKKKKRKKKGGAEGPDAGSFYGGGGRRPPTTPANYHNHLRTIIKNRQKGISK